MLRKVNTLANYARLGLALGADWRSKWLLATMLPRYKSMLALGRQDDQIYRVVIRLEEMTRPLHFRAQDIFIIYEVFMVNPYVPVWLIEEPPRCIVDLGAHIGLVALSFKAYFPNATIHCYEPDPQNFHLLSLNTQEIEGIVIHQEAVGAATCDGVLYVRPMRHSSSSLIPFDGAVKVQVTIRSLDDIIRTIRDVDLIKFDIEGIERQVFAHSRLAQNVRCFVGEVKGSEDYVKSFCSLFPKHKATLKSITSNMHYVYLYHKLS